MNQTIAKPIPSACYFTISGTSSLHFRLNQKAMVITMKDRSKNRKPLQRGRNLSIEAIQAVQVLKRANRNAHNDSSSELERVFDSKFRRLLKFDMMAVLRELLRQNECFLALKVFNDIRKEVWYKPQVLLYADMIAVFASNGLIKEAELVYSYLKAESNLDPNIEGFNALFNALISFKLIQLVMDCYEFMKALGGEPDRSSFRILINGLESLGETSSSAILRLDAQKYYGESLEFLEEEAEIIQLASGNRIQSTKFELKQKDKYDNGVLSSTFVGSLEEGLDEGYLCLQWKRRYAFVFSSFLSLGVWKRVWFQQLAKRGGAEGFKALRMWQTGKAESLENKIN
ncbi:hypothetical protein CCACVL1_02910 [Corchorus capsularis]|uniref:Pentatricopeptide repeat-containing protein n=1 Tax=Corchorus capsularis TaxID=210143 RepID=A0A1R3K4Z8_COCAP|nr:hypothetical protein CCACVL1_02910 [Corchorus capsularis]